MSEESVFVDGMIVKYPHDNAPDFVKASISFKVEEFVAWLEKNASKGWVNVQLKESRGGKLYAALNTWDSEAKSKITTAKPAVEDEDELQF